MGNPYILIIKELEQKISMLKSVTEFDSIKTAKQDKILTKLIIESLGTIQHDRREPEGLIPRMGLIQNCLEQQARPQGAQRVQDFCSRQ